MYDDQRRKRDLDKLEQAQKRAIERMQFEQERVNQRFEKMRERLDHKYGEPSVNQKRIIEAALQLLTQDGLNNLSLRKLADMVDMRAPALYWHFPNKDALIDYMAEAILQRQFSDIKVKTKDEVWQDWVRQQMYKLRKAMLAYPDGARVVAGAHLLPAITLGKLFEYSLVSLEDSGFETQEARHILMTATTYTFGFVIEEQSSPNYDDYNIMKDKLRGMPFPRITNAFEEAHKESRNMDDDFDAGLNYILKGANLSSK
jgi:TetR/AcrR family tetracycline transcriptional repressor